jgi:hypothetical protein
MSNYVNFSLIPKALYAGLPATDKTVLTYITAHINIQTGVSWPSLNTLVRESGLSKRAVIYAVKRLEKSGIISITRQVNTANRYTVDLDLMTSITPDIYMQLIAGSASGALGGSAWDAPGVVHEVHPNIEHNIEGGPQATGIEAAAGFQYLESITGLRCEEVIDASAAGEPPCREEQDAGIQVSIDCHPAHSFLANSEELQPVESTVGIDMRCVIPQLPPTPLTVQENNMTTTMPAGAAAPVEALCKHLSNAYDMPAADDWTRPAEAILKIGSMVGAMEIITWSAHNSFWEPRIRQGGMRFLAKCIERGSITRQWRKAGSRTLPAAPRTSTVTKAPEESLKTLLALCPMFNTAGTVASNFLKNGAATVSQATKNTGFVQLFLRDDQDHYIHVSRIEFNGAHAWKLPRNHGLLPDVVDVVIARANTAWQTATDPVPALAAPMPAGAWVN